MKRIVLDGLEGKTLEFAQSHNLVIDELEQKTATITGLKNQVADLESKNFGQYKAEIDSLKGIVADLEEKAASFKASEKPKQLADAIVDTIKGLGVNSMTELKSFLSKNGTQSFEIKAIVPIVSSANTDTIVRTNLDPTVNFAAVRKLAFLPYLKNIAEESDKDVFGYTEGSYTSNAGYVGEGVGAATNDAASASAKTRKYAKVSAVQSVTTETYEGIPDFANKLVQKLQEGILLYVDGQILNGDGLAPGDVQHIFGLLGVATEFASATTYADSVKLANAADVVAGAKTQIASLNGNYMASHVWMNPLDVYKMERLKDSTGQPIINRDFLGNPTISGLVVVPTSLITANTMLIADLDVVELRTKRALQLKMGQILDGDVLNDRQSAVLFARMQTLVRDNDKAAVVKVSNITTAIADILLA